MQKKERFTEYYQYIVSHEWYKTKIDIIESRGSYREKCRKKKYPAGLQLHHLTYERLFNEEPQDLMLVCKICHKNEHGLDKKPIPKRPKKKKGKGRYKLNKRDMALQKRYDQHRLNN